MSDREPPAASPTAEDYVKAIYSLSHGNREPASTSDLAARLDLTASSVSTTVKRLDAAGLVEHVRYRGVRLSPDGEALALGVLRRHRLLELFLHTSLDIRWEDVHRFAERLEHSASDELIEIIDAKLGHPTVDPHGDPIPTRELAIADPSTVTLAELVPGQHAALVRISDADAAKLRYLTDQGIALGDELEMVARHPFDGPCEVQIGGRTHLLAPNLAQTMRVVAIETA